MPPGSSGVRWAGEQWVARDLCEDLHPGCLQQPAGFLPPGRTTVLGSGLSGVQGHPWLPGMSIQQLYIPLVILPCSQLVQLAT